LLFTNLDTTKIIIADIIAMPANKNPIGIRKNGSDRVPSGKTSEPTTLNIVKHAILATTKRILNKYFFIFNFPPINFFTSD